MKAVFSSEAIDHHRHKMIMAGADLKRYQSNPVLLYFHDDGQCPVGVVAGLRVEDSKLVGGIEWDERDEVALRVKGKYERGMMRGFSIRATILEYETQTIEGQEILVIKKWELLEISCVAIPSNPEALVVEKSAMSKNEAGEEVQVPSVIRVEFFGNSINLDTEMEEVFKKLGLVAKENQNEQEVLKKIGDLEKRASDAESAVAKKDGTIKTLEGEVESLKKAATTKAINDLVDGAVTAKKITPGEADSYKKLAATDFEAVKGLLDGKQGVQSATEQLQQSGENDVVLKAYNENKDKGYMWFFREKPEVLKGLKEKYPAQFKALQGTVNQ